MKSPLLFFLATVLLGTSCVATQAQLVDEESFTTTAFRKADFDSTQSDPIALDFEVKVGPELRSEPGAELLFDETPVQDGDFEEKRAAADQKIRNGSYQLLGVAGLLVALSVVGLIAFGNQQAIRKKHQQWVDRRQFGR